MSNRAAAIKIVRELRRSGHEALLAGGCVRDMLLGLRAKDYDVATSARPKEVMKLFRRTLSVGAKFGVVIVLMGSRQVEVATFRSESDYTDGRHPGKVQFCQAKEDAMRRDFTINGMFYDPVTRETIDYVGGRRDLSRGVIRTIGPAQERFSEDYLRMLRAVRFSTRFEFGISPKTYAAIKKYADKITRISGERICIEVESILVDPNRTTGAAMLIETGLAKQIFKGFADEQAAAGVRVLSCLKKNVSSALALAAFFAGYSLDYVMQKVKILVLSRNQTKHVRFLLDNRGYLLEQDMSLARLRKIASEPYFNDLYELQKAIQRANGKSIGQLVKIKKRIRALGDIELRPKPLLNGYELMKLEVAAGPELGRLAEDMYVAQLEREIHTKAQARKWVKEKIADYKLQIKD